MNTELKRHKHADLIVEHARQMASGELEAGWWVWNSQLKDCKQNVLVYPESSPAWHDEFMYWVEMSDKHPDYQPPKPKLKLIDMSKLPKGSVVTFGGRDTRYLVHKVWTSGEATLHSEAGGHVQTIQATELRIAEQKEFTYWGGGECPVPDGLAVEYVWRDDTTGRLTTPTQMRWTHLPTQGDVIAYRIIGVAADWTDNPEMAS